MGGFGTGIKLIQRGSGTIATGVTNLFSGTFTFPVAVVMAKTIITHLGASCGGGAYAVTVRGLITDTDTLTVNGNQSGTASQTIIGSWEIKEEY